MQELKIETYEELDRQVALAIGKDLTPIVYKEHEFDAGNYPKYRCYHCYLPEKEAVSKPCIKEIAIPRYSKSEDIALKALETFPLWEITRQKDGYRVLFYEMRELTNAARRNDLTSALGETLPLAICYAILKQKGF